MLLFEEQWFAEMTSFRHLADKFSKNKISTTANRLSNPFLVLGLCNWVNEMVIFMLYIDKCLNGSRPICVAMYGWMNKFIPFWVANLKLYESHYFIWSLPICNSMWINRISLSEYLLVLSISKFLNLIFPLFFQCNQQNHFHQCQIHFLRRYLWM